jgi:hypothetical protein
MSRGSSRRHPGLLQYPQAVQLANRLNDPRQHQIAEHLIPASSPAKAQHPVRSLERINQVPHPRGRDRQRPAPASAETEAQIQHALPGGQPLPRDRLQQFQLGVIMRGPDVLDLPRPAMVGVHDLHRYGARRRPDRPHVGTGPLHGPGLVTMKRPAPGDRQSLVLADVVGRRKLEGATTQLTGATKAEGSRPSCLV